MASLKLEKVVKEFGPVRIIHGVDLDIAHGEFVVFVGPSGCGKSTLLRIIAGLEPATSGDILIDGQRVNERPAADRGLAMVFQSYALYPHMSVYQNLSFGLENARMPRPEIEARVMRAATMLQIDKLLARKPRQLSGGQRQRVAIGRAITREPKIFLFDEPLSNLDAELRVQMRVELSKLHDEIGNTMIYVTHDQVEAMTMADKIVVLRGGMVEQVGTPLDLYNKPASKFVAGFIGSPRMNFVPGRVLEMAGKTATVGVDGIEPLQIETELSLARGESVSVGLRPEHLISHRDGAFPIVVEVVEQLGGVSYVHGRLPSGVRMVIAEPGQSLLRPGASVRVEAPANSIHLFKEDEAAEPRPALHS